MSKECFVSGTLYPGGGGCVDGAVGSKGILTNSQGQTAQMNNTLIEYDDRTLQ